MDNPAPSEQLRREVAEQIVSALNLEVGADEIAADQPLYGDGLGLEGTVAFAVGGGEFDYVGALEYTSGGYGDLRLECP